jgi:uncharacterized protein YdeI (YjbR/CyaY-like superfamily)
VASFDEKPIHFFTSTEEWWAFLENDPSDDGVRLQLRKRLSSAPGITWDEALDVALCFGWIDGQGKRLDDDYTLQAFTPRRRNSPWSQINQGHVARLIEAGLMQPAGLAEVERAQADGRWDAAYRVKDAAPPAEFVAALAASPAAAAAWEAMTKQKRWAMIFRLTQAKRPETVTRNVAKFVEMLERGETLP